MFSLVLHCFHEFVVNIKHFIKMQVNLDLLEMFCCRNIKSGLFMPGVILSGL